MKRIATLMIRGKSSRWSVDLVTTSAEFDRMREDGLDIWWLENRIPHWAPVKLWCFFQDLWNFRNPFKE